MPREALDALISGVACYDYLMNHYDTSEVQADMDMSYNNILNILAAQYGVTPEFARKIIAAGTDRDYTRYIDSIIFGTPEPGKKTDTASGAPAAPEDGLPGEPGEAPEGMPGEDGFPAPDGEMMAPPDGAPSPDDNVYYQATVDGNGNIIPDAAPGDGGNVGNPNPDGDNEALVYQIYSN